MDQQIFDELKNITLLKSFLKTENILGVYKKIAVSVSGGADSDVVVDLISKCDIESDVRYVFFNTGLEYQATFEQLDFLEKKYNIKIEKVKVKKPIPLTIRDKGQPFISKWVSEMIKRLQSHDFEWKDEPFDVLLKKYPNCRCALRWWCNDHTPSLCINQNKFLKEFLVTFPPNFKISGDCCKGAKKDPSKDFVKENDIDLLITGVRKAEGRARKTAYKTCFNEKIDKVSMFFPILWYLNDDKVEYENQFGVCHSRCYTEYGLKRTGCAGCPFGKKFEFELDVLEKHEPKLLAAVNNIFKESYEYSRLYFKFRKKLQRELDPQMDIYDFIKED